jgi:hypothetical protein
MIMNWKRCRIRSSICWRDWGNLGQDGRPSGRDSNLEPTDYEAGVQITAPRYWVVQC